MSSLLQVVVDLFYPSAPPPPPQNQPSTHSWNDGPQIFLFGEGVEGFTEVHRIFSELTSVETQPMDDDGNCLFSALAAFLEKDSATVRAEITAYLKEHKENEDVVSLLTTTISEHNERCTTQKEAEERSLGLMLQNEHIDPATFDALTKKLEQETKVKEIEGLDDYLSRIGQDKFFGGSPEVYGAAHLYDISIAVYQKLESKYVPSFICAPLEAPEGKKCLLLYSPERLHYDLIVPSP